MLFKTLSSILINMAERRSVVTEFRTLLLRDNFFTLQNLRKHNNNNNINTFTAKLLNSVSRNGSISSLLAFNSLSRVSTVSSYYDKAAAGPFESLNKLKSLDRLELNRTRIIRKTTGFFIESDISIVEFEVVDVRSKERIFEVEVQHGHLVQEFSIKLFDCGKAVLLSSMHLEANTQAKGLILRIKSPPTDLIGSAYEIPGISKLVIIEDKKCDVLFQVLTNGGIGWTTSAKILSLVGDKILGKIDVTRKESEGPSSSAAAIISINFPANLEMASKQLIIGTSLILIKDY